MIRPSIAAKPLRKTAISLVFGAALGLLAFGAALGQDAPKRGFRDVVELRRLLEVAREAGFSDEEMREITIEDDAGKIINVWAYLEEVERLKRLKAAKLKAQKERVYLTVQDVFADLKKDEPADLTQLRDTIPTNP